MLYEERYELLEKHLGWIKGQAPCPVLSATEIEKFYECVEFATKIMKKWNALEEELEITMESDPRSWNTGETYTELDEKYFDTIYSIWKRMKEMECE